MPHAVYPAIRNVHALPGTRNCCPSPHEGARYLRLAKRRGRKKAIVAIAHSILIIAYHILKYKTPYYDLGPNYFDKLNKQHLVRYHQKRLQSLGFK